MIKKLSKYVGEYKKDSILAPLYITLEVILEVIIPILMALIIDRGIAYGDTSYIARIGIAMLVCAFASMFCGIMSGKHAARASAGFAKNLRRKLYYNIQDFSFSNIDKFSTPSLVTRLTTDITNVQNAYQMIVRILVRSPVMFIFSLLMAWRINTNLSFIFLAVTPFVIIGIYIIILKAYPRFAMVTKMYDNLNNVVQENIRGIRVVKSYVRELYEIEKFKAVSNDIYQNFSTADRMTAFVMPIMQTSVYVCILAISWFGAHMIVSDTLTTGELMTLISYTGQILMSLIMAAMVLVMIVLARVSAERIIEVIDEESNLHNCENPIYDVKDGSIEFKNVNFRYGSESTSLCLKDINFSVNSGETVGIIGGTGSSKTTLVQLIPRLYDVTGGSVEVSGVDVKKIDIKSLRKNVAMVLQKNVLFSGTIKDNMRWGNENATDEEIKRACELAQADSFIKNFPDGYDTHIEQDGSNVSGGQKQRLCIARALLSKPAILILDDSTSAVDTKTDADIQRAFKEEIPNTTKIIIAQRVSSIESADKIIVMDNGTIVGEGTHDELLKNNEIYQEVYFSQVKGGVENER